MTPAGSGSAPPLHPLTVGIAFGTTLVALATGLWAAGGPRVAVYGVLGVLGTAGVAAGLVGLSAAYHAVAGRAGGAGTGPGDREGEGRAPRRRN